MSEAPSNPATEEPEAATTSLAARAKQLAARARAKAEDEKETQDQGQTETALTRLNAELSELSKVLQAHRALRNVGAPVEEKVDLMKPALALRTRVTEVGRPAAQFLHARTRDVTAAKSAMAQANRAVWQVWAAAEIDKLPLRLVPRVNLVQRESTRRRIKDLRAAAAIAPTAVEVRAFTQNLAAVREELQRVKGSEIDGVLDRFVNGRIRLADLSDDELTKLRRDEFLSQQLYLCLS